MSRLTTAQKAGYGLGDFAYNLIWQAVTLFLIFIYTDVAGLSPYWAGVVYIAASVWDAITDPIMGGLADRTRTSRGRYRPYILWSAAPLAFVYWLAFSVPSVSDGWIIVWAFVTHFLLRTVYTVSNIPYSSLTARMTSDADDRARLTGWRMQFAVAGGLFVATFLPGLVAVLGGDDPRTGYSLTVALFALLMFAILIASYFLTSEPDEIDPLPARQSLNPVDLLKDVLGVAAKLRLNGPLARVFLAIIIGGMCIAMLSKSVPYYFKYIYGDQTMVSGALVTLMITQFVVIPAYVFLAARTSKRVAWLAGSGVMAVGLTALFANQLYTQFVILPIFCVIGAGAGALGVMFWSMLPDTVEYSEWATGNRDEAKTYAFASFAIKMSNGTAGFLFGVLLGLAGFEANVEQTEDTIFAIKSIMTLIPLLGLLICAVIIWGYPLDRAAHEKLLTDIKARQTT